MEYSLDAIQVDRLYGLRLKYFPYIMPLKKVEATLLRASSMAYRFDSSGHIGVATHD